MILRRTKLNNVLSQLFDSFLVIETFRALCEYSFLCTVHQVDFFEYFLLNFIVCKLNTQFVFESLLLEVLIKLLLLCLEELGEVQFGRYIISIFLFMLLFILGKLVHD